jgi:Mce-associated membrane protein
MTTTPETLPAPSGGSRSTLTPDDRRTKRETMSEARTESHRRPTAAIALLAVLVIAAAAWGGWLYYRKHEAAKPALTTGETQAMDAARQFVVNVFTYNKASFDSDFQRALSGSTGDLSSQVTNTKAALQASLTGGTITGTKGEVKSAGVEQTSSAGIEVLVVAETYSIDSSNKSTDTGQQRMEVTMVKKNGKWLASALTAIGYQ